MKVISIFAALAFLIGGAILLRTRDVDTGWCHLIPPKTDNEFAKKQAEMMQLSGAYRKISLSEDEIVTVKIHHGPDSTVHEKTILGTDSSEISIAVYNYPGRYSRGRNEHVTEVKIADEKKTERLLFERPLHYTAGKLLNHGLGEYREVLMADEETIYSLLIFLEKKRAEQ